MNHFKHIFLLFTFSFLSGSLFAQEPKLEWLQKHAFDSITTAYTDSQYFNVYKKCKLGYFGLQEGLMVPPRYDEISKPVYYAFKGYFNQYDIICLFYVRVGKKWGIRAYTNRYDYDTINVLQCKYDKIEINKHNDEIWLYVEQGKKKGIYFALNNRWGQALSELTAAAIPKINPKTDEIFIVKNFDKDSVRLGYRQVGGDDEQQYEAEYPELNKNDQWEKDGKYIIFKVGRDDSSRCGVKLVLNNAVLLEPKFINISYEESAHLFNCISESDHEKKLFVMQWYDTLGKKASPEFSLALERGNKWLLQNRETGKFGVYDEKTVKALEPLIYEDVKISGQYGRRHYFFKKNEFWFVYNVDDGNFLKDSFAGIYSSAVRPEMLVKKDGQVSIYNLQAGIIKTISNVEVVSCSDTIAIVRSDGKSKFLNFITGRISDFGYDSLCFVEKEENMSPYLIREYSEKAFYACQNSKWGLINYKNEILMPFKFDHAYAVGGIGEVAGMNSILSFNSNGFQTFYSVGRSKVIADSITFLYPLEDHMEDKGGFKYSQTELWMDHEGAYFFKTKSKFGVLLFPDSIAISAVYDTFFIVGQHGLMKKDKACYVINPETYKVDRKMNYDSFYMIKGDNLVLCKGGKQFMDRTNMTFRGDLQMPEGVDRFWFLKYYSKDSFKFSFVEELSRRENDMPGLPGREEDSYSFSVYNDDVCLYAYNLGNKIGILTVDNFYSPAVFDEVRMGANQLLWVRQKGKWGIVKYLDIGRGPLH